MINLVSVRHTATSPLPTDVANSNCVQDALSRLRQELVFIDSLGTYTESGPAPESLVQARKNLFAWIEEARR